MTDRERLLEQVREAEERAARNGMMAHRFMAWPIESDGVKPIASNAFLWAHDAAHHALTAMALREVVDTLDTVGWAFRG